MEIYLCDIKELNIAERYEQLLTGLSVEEQRAITRFRQEEGRHRALVRELLLRRVLRETFGEVRIVLGKNAHGKPFIEEIIDGNGHFCMIEHTDEAKRRQAKEEEKDGCNPADRKEGYRGMSQTDGEDGYALFDFSISHSGDFVAIGFGSGRIGIDVEQVGRAKDFISLLRFYSEAERQWVLDAADPEDEFYRVWTFREAFSKEEGVGLSLFEKEDAAIDYAKRRVAFNGTEYGFFEYALPGYHLTACAAAAGERPGLTVLSSI